MSVLSTVKMVAGGLFSRPATKMYPAKPQQVFPRTRGSIRNRIDECIFCGLCSRKCPTRAITVNRAEKEWSIDRFDCLACGACVDACPKKCLDMDNRYTAPAAQKTVDHYHAPAAEALPAKSPETGARAAQAAPADGSPVKKAASSPSERGTASDA